jgi:hypothetical protein
MVQKYESLFEYAQKLKKEKPQKSDMVNAPKHYILTDTLQVKDVREAMLQKLMRDEIVLPYEDAHDWITAWEYITRAPFKNGEEDYRKALWYLNNLLERMEKRRGFVYDHKKDD